MPHATTPSPGLQALILCGPGESLSTFTSTPKDFSKALVPIANRPMVWYPLDWCYRMGINDITLITPAESKSALEAALATHPALTSLPNPKAEILAPEDLTQTTGTGEILRFPEVQKIIESDFVVLPCDLVSELDGSDLVQQWMTLTPLSLSSKGAKQKGGLAVFYATHGLEGISTKKDETDFIATTSMSLPPAAPPQGSLRQNIETLVMAMPTDTLNDKLEEHKDIFKVRTQLSHKYGQVKLKTKHRDAHVYVFPKWVKDYANSNEKFDSISEDVVGWWAKAQWQAGLGEKLGMHSAIDQKDAPEEDLTESGHLEDDLTELSALSSTKTTLPVRHVPASSFATRVGTPALSVQARQPLQIPPLLAYVQPAPSLSSSIPLQPLIRRVDTSSALLSISLYLAKQSEAHRLAHEHKVHPSAKLGLQSRVSQEDSLIAENVTIGTRSIIKESVVGANCEIGNHVRLSKCLLMDGVVVGDGVQLTGCIIGRRARIEGTKPSPGLAEGQLPDASEGDAKKKGKKPAVDDDEEKTRLTECEVAPNFVVEAGTEAKGEKMMAFDTEGDMDEFGIGDEEADDDDDDDDDDAE